MRLLVAMLLTTVLLPQTQFKAESVPFVIAFAALVLNAAIVQRSMYLTKAVLALLLFQGIVIVHSIFVLVGQVSVEDYVRGAIPFCFLACAYLTLKVIGIRQIHRLYLWIIAVAGIFALQNLILLPAILTGKLWRATYANPNHDIPLPLVGFHFSVALAMDKTRAPRYQIGWWSIALLMLVAELLTGTRSLLIGMLLPLLLYQMTRLKSLRTWLITAAIVLPLAAAFFLLPTDFVSRGFRIGYSQKGSIDTRVQENTLALGYIETAPVLGHGVGFKFDTNGLYYDVASVSYVHNSFLYLMMDCGVWGLLYFFPAYFACRRTRKLRHTEYGPEVQGVVLSLVGLIIFSIGFVVVRLIQFNVIYAVLIAMLCIIKQKYGRQLSLPLLNLRRPDALTLARSPRQPQSV